MNEVLLRDELEGIACDQCQAAIVPFSTGAQDFGFACINGHVTGIKELFAAQSQLLRRPLENLIQSWVLAARQMSEGARLAGAAGQHDVAKRLHQRECNLEARIEVLRGFMRAYSATVPVR